MRNLYTEQIAVFNENCLQHVDYILSEATVLVTDPPYGIDYRSGRTGLRVEGDASLYARDRLLHAWGDRPAIVFGSWKQPPPQYTHTRLIWDKGCATGMGNLSIPWKPNTEDIYVQGQGFTGRRDSSVLSVPFNINEARLYGHPTMKPVRLMEQLLCKIPKNWIVCDPFAGTGSTLLACQNLGLKAFGFEIDPAYVETIVKRLGANEALFAM